MTSEQDIELLELSLDRALDPSQQQALAQRLTAEAELHHEFLRIQEFRQLRARLYHQFEAQASPDLAERILAEISRRESHRAWYFRILDYREQIATAAACVAIFLIGWQWGRNTGTFRMLPNTSTAQPVGLITQQQIPAASGPVYEVRVNDRAGRLVGVQRFNTLQDAQQYIEDARNRLFPKSQD